MKRGLLIKVSALLSMNLFCSVPIDVFYKNNIFLYVFCCVHLKAPTQFTCVLCISLCDSVANPTLDMKSAFTCVCAWDDDHSGTQSCNILPLSPHSMLLHDIYNIANS